MLGRIAITSRRIWLRIWHHRLLYFRHRLLRHPRERSPLFYRRCLLALLALALAGVEVGTGQILDTCTAVVAQGKINRVPCYKWPTIAEIERILAENPAVLNQIEAVPPGGATVSVAAWENRPGWVLRCPGKGMLTISYAGYREMRAIKSIIGNRKYLMGIPYAMYSY